MKKTNKDISIFDCSRNDISLPSINKLFLSGRISSGKYNARFEDELQSKLGKKNICTVSDLSSALYLIFKSINIQSRDEIICTSFNCLSSTSPINEIGARVVFADLEDETPFVSVGDCVQKISNRTKAIIIYHLAGYPTNLDKLINICKERNILLIEDANNSFGASFKDSPVGTLADFSVFSFYPNRQVSATNGAAIYSKSSAHYSKILKLRKHGIKENFRLLNGEINPHSNVDQLSLNYSMSNLDAYLALTSLKSFDKRKKKILRNANFYHKELKKIQNIKMPTLTSGSEGMYWGFMILADNSSELLSYLKLQGIGATKFHYPNHKYTAFRSQKLSLQNTDNFHTKVIFLPCGWWIGTDELRFIVKMIKNFYE
tara:strand:+ start:1350 stop:2471 length:1122 start_codon:yes stop_codon:yes gene_type:complete